MPEPTPDRFVVSIQQHKAIALAVAQRDVEAARSTMIEHIETSLRNVVSPENQIEIEIERLI